MKNINSSYSAFIFDLDGTLIDSAPDIAASINKYVSARNWNEFSVEEVKRHIGNGPKRLIYDLFKEAGMPTDDQTILNAHSVYLENYNNSPARKTKFYEKVKEDLLSLYDSGYRMGICTNKPHELTQKVLNELDISQFFEVALGADAVEACKPDPGHLKAVATQMFLQSEDWAYIGDTTVDQQTAEAAGVPFYVVPWGGGSEVEVPPAYRLNRILDLVNSKTTSVA